jgi:hypothetical protein
MVAEMDNVVKVSNVTFGKGDDHAAAVTERRLRDMILSASGLVDSESSSTKRDLATFSLGVVRSGSVYVVERLFLLHRFLRQVGLSDIGKGNVTLFCDQITPSFQIAGFGARFEKKVLDILRISEKVRLLHFATFCIFTIIL